jgi:bacillopeptidase F (M6 metalloprotease family)
MSVEQGAITIPSDPSVRKEIKDLILDISDQWVMKESYDLKVKEAIEAGAKKFELPKEYLTKMAQMYHKNTYSKEQTKSEDVFSLYDACVGGDQ